MGRQATVRKIVLSSSRSVYGEGKYECPRCGAKFWSNTMQCPNCGTRFTRTREDMTAYDDELEEELDMDEWDEEEK